MITQALLTSLPMSVGVALSPLPVAAVIIMLMTARATTNAPVFLLGWIAGILTVGVIVFFAPGLETSGGEPTSLAGLIRIALGIGLMLLAWRQWRRRPVRGAPVEVPAMLRRLESIGPIHAWVTGWLLSAVNPKNLLLNAAGAVRIDESVLNAGAQFTALLVYAAIASLTVATPIAGYLVARGRADAVLGRWKDWLIRNNGTVLIVLLVVVGVFLIIRGVSQAGILTG